MTSVETTRSQLLGLSFDAQASPVLRAGATGDGDDRIGAASDPVVLADGWGLGCYVEDQRAATLLSTISDDPQPLPSGSALSSRPLRSSLFVAHTPGSDVIEPVSQPLRRAYAGRHFLFSVAGSISTEACGLLPLDDDFDLIPVGDSVDQYVVSWLISRIRASGARTLAEFGWESLRAVFARINAWGRASFLLSDGVDLVAYRDLYEDVPMHWARRIPPHASSVLESPELVVDCAARSDEARTLLVFSTTPLKGARWTPLEPGELRVARRGAVIWSSHPATIDEQVFTRMPALGVADLSSDEWASAGMGVPHLPQTPAPVHSPRAPLEPATLSILHETKYSYEVPVERSHHRFCLQPTQDARQEILDQSLEISVPGVRRDFEDVFGNRTTIYDIREPFHEITVTSRMTVRVDAVAVSDLRSPLRRDQIPLVWMPWQRQMMEAYLLPPELPEGELRDLSEFAMSFVERNDSDLVATLLDLNRTIYRDFTYLPSSTTLETTPFEVYEQRRGVCQDFANLMICIARLLGVPARYRVGYIYTGSDYENRIQSDASHAWAELYLPWTGWCGFDPTNGTLTGADHVRVACGRHFRDAAPTSGTIYEGGGGERLSVRVEVDRLDP